MTWSKMYIRSEIIKKKSLYIASIIWSWWGLQHWSEYEIFETIEEANSWVLRRRTNGTLVYDIDSEEEKKL